MRAIGASRTSLPASQPLTMAHKIDLGFHHHNLVVTSNRCTTAASANTGSGTTLRASSGVLLPQYAPNMVSCTVRSPRGHEVIMRCMPAEDNGPVDPSASSVLDGVLDLSGTEASDAIIGDDYSNLSDDSAHQQQATTRSGSGMSGTPDVDVSMANAIKAQIPKGALAHDAALCEKMPGDEPGNLDEREIADLHGRPPISQAQPSTGSSSEAHTSASAPANNTEEIKKVVRDETFGQG